VNEGPNIPAKLFVDITKLKTAIDGKRRSDGISWRRLAARYGLSPSTLQDLDRPDPRKAETLMRVDLAGRVLISMLDYLKKPYTDFVKIEPLEVEDGGSQ
jgi:hypothetical protein